MQGSKKEADIELSVIFERHRNKWLELNHFFSNALKW